MKTIVITGATSGIGLETARLLARQGFFVIGVSRCEEKCLAARESILADNSAANVTFFQADLMQQSEVNRVAEEISCCLEEKSRGELFALINNAGCVRSWYMTTDEGYEQQFALNHLAAFLLTYRLLPALKKGRGRVIMTGSKSHRGIKVQWDNVMLRKRYNPLKAYKQSKLCNLLFAQGLNDRYAAQGIRAYVVDPGLVNTDIGNKDNDGLVSFIWTLRKGRGVSPEIPAQTFAYLCQPESLPPGLYYYQCKEKKYSKEVTRENACRLFALSERYCGIDAGKGK